MTEHERQYGWVGELADSFVWREDVRYRVGLSEHINLKDARAYRTGVRRASADPTKHSTRRLTLLDSSVVRGAVAKGRSSSRRLNNVVPELLAADIQPGTLPVPTKQNPADAATRSGRTRAVPLHEPPAWLPALEVGDCIPFDEVYAARARRIPAEFFPAIPLAKSGDAGGPGDPAAGERIGEAKKPGPPPRARSASAVRR